LKTCSIEVLAKPLEAWTSSPQTLNKCGQYARAPGKTGGFARTSLFEIFFTIGKYAKI